MRMIAVLGLSLRAQHEVMEASGQSILANDIEGS